MRSFQLRRIGRLCVEDRGFDVREKPGQGYVPGSRLVASKEKREIVIAVKASQQRELGFTRQSTRLWRTLHAVDEVVAVVPGLDDGDAVDVYGFFRADLVRIFDRAWRALKKAKRPVGFNMPVFVPIDEVPRKRLGHDIANLKEAASWALHLSAEELVERSTRREESYVEAFRRRFAAENGVGIDQVAISIVGRSK